jgi:hypothetical protein
MRDCVTLAKLLKMKETARPIEGAPKEFYSMIPADLAVAI